MEPDNTEDLSCLQYCIVECRVSDQSNLLYSHKYSLLSESLQRRGIIFENIQMINLRNEREKLMCR